MRTTPKRIVLAIIACCNVTAFVLAGDAPAPSISADAALVKLKEGNLRFATSNVSQAKPTAARRKETAQAQHSFAIIVGCADSRVAPELIFDQNLGDLFASFAPRATWSTTMRWEASNTW